MKKILLITLVSLIVNTNIIYAECTTKDKEYYESIKDKYNISYEFDKDTKAYKLYLTYGDISTFTYYAIGDGIDNSGSYMDENKIVIDNLIPGNYAIYVIGASESCSDTFREEAIALPQYNEYSFDPICEGIEEFVLCSPTYDKEIDYDTFISRVNSYKKNKSAKDSKTDNKTEKITITEWIKNNSKYIIYGLIGIAVIIIMIIIIKIIYNRERKRRRLE